MPTNCKDNSVQRVSLAHLIGILAIARGARMVAFTARTDARLKKRGNPLPEARAIKVARINGIVNFRYAKSVNNQRIREASVADFEAQKRAWGVRMQGYPFVAHLGNLYLEVKVERVLWVRYEDVLGQALGLLQVKAFLPPPPRDPGDGQELEKGVVLKDYKVQNIFELSIDGEQYAIDPASIAECVNTNIAGAVTAPGRAA